MHTYVYLVGSNVCITHTHTHTFLFKNIMCRSVPIHTYYMSLCIFIRCPFIFTLIPNRNISSLAIVWEFLSFIFGSKNRLFSYIHSCNLYLGMVDITYNYIRTRHTRHTCMYVGRFNFLWGMVTSIIIVKSDATFLVCACVYLCVCV